MICPKCGCHDRVSRTITRDHQTIRVRRCIMCGHSYETVEQAAEVPQESRQEEKPVPKKKKGASPKPKSETPSGALAAALSKAN